MPEYLAPGVYVEETSFRAKSIEGVGTSTTAFVGPTRRGPIGDTPELITSLPDFEHVYGSFENLAFADAAGNPTTLNFIAHAVRAYFDNGGSRLYVMRAENGGAPPPAPLISRAGRRRAQVSAVARFRGRAGNGRLTFRTVGRPVSDTRFLDGAPPMRCCACRRRNAPPPPTRGRRRRSSPRYRKDVTGDGTRPGRASPAPGRTRWWSPTPCSTPTALRRVDRRAAAAVGRLHRRRRLRAGLGRAVASPQRSALGRRGARRAAVEPRRRSCENLIGLRFGADVSAADLHAAVTAPAAVPGDTDDRRFVDLAGGSDGCAPVAGNETSAGQLHRTAWRCSPGWRTSRSSPPPAAAPTPRRRPCSNALIAHAERRRAYRIAVLDTPPRQLPGRGAHRARPHRLEVRRALLPVGGRAQPAGARPAATDIPSEIALPPSGFVCGIYARNDVERGVYKAPANEVVRGALRFEIDVNFAPAGDAQPDRRQLPALLSRPRLPGLGRAAGVERPGMEVRQRPALLQLPRGVDRPRHAVGGVRAQRRAAVGQRAADDHRLPLQRVAQRRAARQPRPRRPSSCAATAAR